MKEFIIAVIEFLGAILAAIITRGTSLIGISSKKHTGKQVAGQWDGVWYVTYPDDKKRSIVDFLTITETRQGKLRGEGNVPNFGKYLLQGKNSEYCVLLSFNGVHDKEYLAGVVLLKKFPAKDRLDGHWIQLDIDGEMMGGTVTFTKQK